MGWLGKLLGTVAVDAAEMAVSSVLPTKVDFHIDRFKRAIEQCKNPNKMQQLVRDLAYYEALKAAQKHL